MAALLGAALSANAATTLTIVDTPSLTGVEQHKPNWPDGQNSYQSFNSADNVALGATTSASSSLSGYPEIHDVAFLTDGFYGNGSSWISSDANSSVQIDLGRVIAINSVMFGRDRLGFFDERDPGQFSISVSQTGSVGTFNTLYTSSPGFEIHWDDGVKISFDGTSARYVNLSFENAGTAIDEVQITAVPEPETYAMLLAGLGLIGGIARRRKEQRQIA
jgi:hypothetical protein